ncbi:hypothetical protein J1N35_011400 [Gossypium stocksii]|uniref:Uncharacterized protein n=1 Tax=Gossypium stocksii TaxID=47602 RepID=A0A9D3W2P2_9ROSI|nr:hypothetical protein J1N35_011400 [Gossypium stocksii]
MLRLIMPCKRTCASSQIDESQSKFHCEEATVRYESIFKNQQMHLEKGFILKESSYVDFMARIRQVAEALNWELFCEKRPSVDEELVWEFYANLTLSELIEVPICGIKTIDVGKIILREILNYAVRCSGLAYFPFTITILCSKAKILTNVKKTGYSQGTIIDWDLYRIAGILFYSNKLKKMRISKKKKKKIPQRLS